mgnify:CR=1 FL=1
MKITGLRPFIQINATIMLRRSRGLAPPSTYITMAEFFSKSIKIAGLTPLNSYYNERTNK